MRRTPVDVLFVGTTDAGAQLAASVLRRLTGRRTRVCCASNARAARFEAQLLREGAQLMGVRLPTSRMRPLSHAERRPFHVVISVGERPADQPWPIAAQFAGLPLDCERPDFADVARQLVAQTDHWWTTHSSNWLESKRSAARTYRPFPRAQWRTKPGRNAPILLVSYLKSQRRCIDVCAHLERSGFHVVCGEKYGRDPERIGFVPDAVVLRVDGPHTEPGLREDFATLPALRDKLPSTRIVALLDHSLSGAEAKLFEALEVHPLQHSAKAQLVRALRESGLRSTGRRGG
jgi:hypothetical protein